MLAGHDSKDDAVVSTSGAKPRFGRGGTGGRRSPAAAPATVQCHFRAEMDEEVVVKHTATIE